MKLALGTVQFGLSYGVSNSGGQTSFEETQKILKYASDIGIDTLDTASSYGESEKILGNSGSLKAFKIVTKTPVYKGAYSKDGTSRAIESSLDNLRVESVYGLLVHHADDLLDKKNGSLFYRSLADLKEKGLTKKIGVSIYEINEIEAILERYEIDLVQIPFNVLDQNLLHTGLLDRLKDQGIEIHCRSAFLQGLLLMPLSKIPNHLQFSIPYLQRFHEVATQNKLSGLELAIGYINSVSQIDKIVVGVNTTEQLREIRGALSVSLSGINVKFLNSDEKKVVRPNLWPHEAK